jgi:hypothetical protein
VGYRSAEITGDAESTIQRRSTSRRVCRSRGQWINKRPTTSTIWKPLSKPRTAPDSSKGSAPATSTPKRLATRGSGQAEDTTSSGTRIITDLSHDACSSRPLLSLSPLPACLGSDSSPRRCDRKGHLTPLSYPESRTCFKEQQSHERSALSQGMSRNF